MKEEQICKKGECEGKPVKLTIGDDNWNKTTRICCEKGYNTLIELSKSIK